MKITAFVEGATASKGGLGLVGVPMILSSTAARGHEVVLLLAGPINPGRENFLVADLPSALCRREGAGTFGIVAFKTWNFLPIQAWATWSFAPSLLWRACQQVRRADFVTLHSLYSFPVMVGYLCARWHKKPYGIWPHGVLAPFQRRVSAKRKWLYNRLIANRILNNASLIFYSAKGERQEAAPLALRPPSVDIPHGVDLSEFATMPAKGRLRKRRYPGQDIDLIVFLARLNAKKGLDLLIQAMALVVKRRPRARLAIVGPADPPSFERKLLGLISDSGIGDYVAVVGRVDQDEKLDVLADADVFVLPSQAENFGFSVFEAMASRVPVVVSDTLNYADEIRRSGAGLSVPRNPGSFADAIVELLKDNALRQHMGENGFELARRYGWDQNGAKVERAVESILQGHEIPAGLTE